MRDAKVVAVGGGSARNPASRASAFALRTLSVSLHAAMASDAALVSVCVVEDAFPPAMHEPLHGVALLPARRPTDRAAAPRSISTDVR